MEEPGSVAFEMFNEQITEFASSVLQESESLYSIMLDTTITMKTIKDPTAKMPKLIMFMMIFDLSFREVA